MNRKPIVLALLAALAAAAPLAARAQVTVTVPATPPGGAAPLQNGVVMGVASPIYLTVTNNRAGATLTQIAFTGQNTSPIAGGAGPDGWVVSDLTYSAATTRYTITFRVATCGVGDIATGASRTFRIDYQRPTRAGDNTTGFRTTTPSDPCGGATGWTAVANPSFNVRSFSVSASAAPVGGASPLASSVTYTVINRSTTQRTVSVALPTVTPSAGATPSACAPASQAIAANGGVGTFTCPVSFTTATPVVYGVASNASGPTSQGLGATTPVAVGATTASFAFDRVDAGTGDTVRATLQVTNRTAAPISVTPPAYGALALANVARVAGALDPAALPALAAGATASVTYVLTVTGAPGSSYTAAGSAPTSAGTTNVATTPAGTASGWGAALTPGKVVTSRQVAPFAFSVGLANGGAVAVPRVDVVNPQNGVLAGMARTTASGLACAAPTVAGSTTTMSCTGSLARGSTATLGFSFTGVGAAGTYPIRVVVYGAGGYALQTITRNVTVRSTVDFDVGNLSVLSAPAGQTLRWTNTSTATGAHDGVVVFRSDSPATLPLPADFTVYTPGVGQVIYADRDASPVTSVADPTTGTSYYRVCNHDEDFVYSNCSSGYWNGSGWLDSVTAPANGWAQQLGTGVFLAPGLIPGAQLGIVSNAPAVFALTAASGGRTADAVSLSGTPSGATPAVTLGNGLRALFVADTGGGVRAIDLATGLQAWSLTVGTESFVGGVTGALASMLPAAYGTDVLFMGSTTGNLLAVDARTGALLWTLAVPGPVRALAHYAFGGGVYRLYVATDGAGVRAYDLSASGPGTAPVALAGYAAPPGSFTLGCTSADPTYLACADTGGAVTLVNKASGAVSSTVSTGLTTPVSIWIVPGGILVSDAARVVRVAVSGATLSTGPAWSPGLALSRIQVFVTDGFVYVGGSDRRIHKLAMADLAHLGESAPLSSLTPSPLLGHPSYDVVNDRLLVGVSDGRVWALPKF